ncbi:adenylyl-sulfate kinase [Calidifontibacillus erzurumensis]|uniref:Adenylyl-sulfate kinase n=1 Tax=Calidifontibacillus erzurumensis TaxID=2741433 RepID=A0A8J8GK62_9BACI|nr:adenylyl-sulfate kinase [Calidifontibacillus erzurumensis]NSL53251.1 adenylyl-sulfate kinase [Calidifontibacillus erzurumensis]
MRSNHIVWHPAHITKEDRRRLNGHKSAILWFTGFSGAGKSTLSVAVEKELHHRGIRTYVLDGDNIRHGLNRNLGFSAEDRQENIRRIGEVSKLFIDAGIMTLTAFISPYRKDREMVRRLVGPDEFVEIYVKCSLEECEKRDPKGLYKKARKGEIKGFTGIDAPYEAPINPELIVETDKESLQQSVAKILYFLEEKGYLNV